MRLVVLGAGGAHKTERSIADAARSLGHACRLVNVVSWSRYAGALAGRMIRYLADAFEPDFVLVTRHAIVAGEPVLRGILQGRNSAFWYFDPLPRPEVLALGRLVGRMYLTYLKQIESYQAAGIPFVGFLPQGVDPRRDRPADQAPSGYRCDASFVGSGQYPHRYPVLRAVAAVCRLQVRGPGWAGAPRDLPVAGGKVHGRRLRQVIRGAAISLGASAYPEQDSDWASASNRMWKIMGCGGFYLGPYVRDLDWLAAGGRHCAWYRSTADAVEQVHHYLGHPDERQRVATAGREHALRWHTYAHRLDLLLAGRQYEPRPLPSDDAVIPELENPHTGHPLDCR